MRTITALLLLSSLCFVGCNSPVSQNTDPIDIVEDEIEELDDLDKLLDSLTPQQQMELLVYVDAMGAWDARGRVEPEPVPPEWLKPYLDEAVPLASKLRSSPVSDGFPTFDPPSSSEPEGHHGPDPFAAETSEPHGLKSGASKKPEVWINFYYLRGHEMNEQELQRIIGWSHKNGLTIGTPGEKDFLLTQVRLIDYVKYRDRIKRNLVYEGYDRAYLPTLVLLDSQGRELCYNVGQINFRHLQEDFDRFNRSPTRRVMGGPLEATVKESLTVDSADWVCGPGGCRPRGR